MNALLTFDHRQYFSLTQFFFREGKRRLEGYAPTFGDGELHANPVTRQVTPSQCAFTSPVALRTDADGVIYTDDDMRHFVHPIESLGSEMPDGYYARIKSSEKLPTGDYAKLSAAQASNPNATGNA